MRSGSVYYMDIVLTKNKDMVMFEGPARHTVAADHGRFGSGGPQGFGTFPTGYASSRGMHYGPALRWTSNSGTYGFSNCG